MSPPPIESAIWIYPVDLLDGGVEAVLDEVAGLGVGGISLAASYHAGRLLLPHNPRRAVHFLEDGVAYFPVDESRYRGHTILVPKTAEAVRDVDLWGATRQASSARGLGVSAWTIGTHNSRLGRQHPECTIQNVFGDRYMYALCPAHPAVRTYLATLCHEITEICGPSAPDLESAGFMGYAHRSHHDKIAFRLDLAHEFLLSLCVCDHCRAGCQERGVDTDRLVRVAREALERYFENGGPPRIDTIDAMEEFLGGLLGPDTLSGLIRARTRSITRLVGDIRAAVPSNVSLRLVASPSPYATGASAGLALSRIAPHVDAIIVDLFASNPDDMVSRLRLARASAGAAAHIFANIRAHEPDADNSEAFVDTVRRVKAEEIQGIRFYHYGLIPRAHLSWIARAMEVVKA